jgi:hypothetical protein
MIKAPEKDYDCYKNIAYLGEDIKCGLLQTSERRFIQDYPVISNLSDSMREIFKFDWFYDVAIHSEVVTFDSILVQTG